MRFTIGGRRAILDEPPAERADLALEALAEALRQELEEVDYSCVRMAMLRMELMLRSK